eukprot:4756668-Pyramimonas_sp.AAC.1
MEAARTRSFTTMVFQSSQLPRLWIWYFSCTGSLQDKRPAGFGEAQADRRNVGRVCDWKGFRIDQRALVT